jgi:hypothetical protein
MMRLCTKFLQEAIDMSTELATESNDIRIPIFYWDEKLLWFPFLGGASEIYLVVDVFLKVVESLPKLF